MIKAILILNTAGKVRLVRIYDETVSIQNLSNADEQALTSTEALIQELTVKIASRKDHYCNFIDDCTSVLRPNKVIYRYTISRI